MKINAAIYILAVFMLFAGCSHRNANVPIQEVPPDTIAISSEPEPPESPAENAENSTIPLKYYWVKAEYVNLRTGPDRNSEIIKILPRGTKLRILDNIEEHSAPDGQNSEDWRKVETGNKNQLVGYVRSTLISNEKPVDPLNDFHSRLRGNIVPGESIPSLISSVHRGDDEKSLFIYVTGDWNNILKAYTVFPISNPNHQKMQSECVARLENIANHLYSLWNQSLEINGYGQANYVKFIDDAGITVGEITAGPGNDPKVMIKR